MTNEATLREVLEKTRLITMDDIATLLGLSYHRVKILKRSPEFPPQLPIPGVLLWTEDSIIKWAKQEGRMGQDGTVRKLLPPGRPRKKEKK